MNKKDRNARVIVETVVLICVLVIFVGILLGTDVIKVTVTPLPTPTVYPHWVVPTATPAPF